MDQDTTDQAMYHADMQKFEQQAEVALKESATRPLRQDEITLLAFLAGLHSERT